MAAASTTATRTPPAPPAEAAPPAQAAAPERSAPPLHPLPPSRLQLAEHAVHHWVITLPHEQLEDVLDPAFFGNCPMGDMGLRPGDISIA